MSQNAAVQKIVNETLGDSLDNVGQEQVQSFISSIDSLVQKNELPMSIGQAVHAASLVLCIMDKSMRVVVWNTFAAKTTGVTQDEIKGKDIARESLTLLPGTSKPSFEAAFNQCLNGHPVHGTIIQMGRRDGALLKMLCNFSPLVTPRGTEGVVMIAHDITTIVGSNASSAATAETPNEIVGANGTNGILYELICTVFYLVCYSRKTKLAAKRCNLQVFWME